MNSVVTLRDPFPVFVGGEHRSGTTLLSVVLDSHHLLEVGPELDFAEPRNLGSFVLEACVLLHQNDPRVLGEGTDTQDPYYYDVAHFVKQCQRFGIEPLDLADIVEAHIRRLGRDVVSIEDRCTLVEDIARAKLAVTGKWAWGIKLQRKIQDVDVYAGLWPTARFLHIIRDGRDVASSHLRTVPDWGYPTIDDTAYKWSNLVLAARLRAPVDRYLEVKYERLVTEPESECRRICDFLGVPFDEGMVRHHEQPHSLHANSWGHPAARATGSALSTAAVGRFQNDLSEDQISKFEDIAGGTLKSCNYPLHAGRARDLSCERLCTSE